MATVSVIVSVVLTGCSYGNRVCNSGSVQIKPSLRREVRSERSRGGEREGRAWTPSSRTFDWMEREGGPTWGG